MMPIKKIRWIQNRENLEDGLLQGLAGGADEHLLRGSFVESQTLPKPLQIQHMEAKISESFSSLTFCSKVGSLWLCWTE